MSVLFVYGMSSLTSVSHLKEFKDALMETTASIKSLNITPSQNFVIFVPDLMRESYEKEIIIMVEGLFDQPERTEDIRKYLAEELVKCTKNFFPNVKIIECFVKLNLLI